MKIQIIGILAGLVLVSNAGDPKKLEETIQSDESAVAPKKHEKRGLLGIGYGYGGHFDNFAEHGVLSGNEHFGHNLYDSHTSLGNYGHSAHVKEVIVTKKVEVPVPYPVVQKVPYPVKVPVHVPVDRPYPVHIEKPYPVPVEKPVPYPVVKHVPYPVKVPVKVAVPHPVPVPYPKPVPYPVYKPVPYPVKVPVVVEKQVPIYVKEHNYDHHFEGGVSFGGHGDFSNGHHY